MINSKKKILIINWYWNGRKFKSKNLRWLTNSFTRLFSKFMSKRLSERTLFMTSCGRRTQRETKQNHKNIFLEWNDKKTHLNGIQKKQTHTASWTLSWNNWILSFCFKKEKGYHRQMKAPKQQMHATGSADANTPTSFSASRVENSLFSRIIMSFFTAAIWDMTCCSMISWKHHRTSTMGQQGIKR